MIDYLGLKIYWLGHDCFRIEGKVNIYIDPFRLDKVRNKADLILITHSHSDHFSITDIIKIATDDTIIVAPKKCENELKKHGLIKTKISKAGETLSILGIILKVLPAYNVNKLKPDKTPFHNNESEDFLGYLIKIDEVSIYHTGDTDFIPEMNGLNVDVMFIPVSGTYVMTPDEAAEAVRRIKPKLALPMHYGSIVGDIKDAEKFSTMAECKVIILNKET